MSGLRPTFYQIALRNSDHVSDQTMFLILSKAFRISDEDARRHVNNARSYGSSPVFEKTTHEICETKMLEIDAAKKEMLQTDLRAMGVRFEAIPVPNNILLDKS